MVLTCFGVRIVDSFTPTAENHGEMHGFEINMNVLVCGSALTSRVIISKVVKYRYRWMMLILGALIPVFNHVRYSGINGFTF